MRANPRSILNPFIQRNAEKVNKSRLEMALLRRTVAQAPNYEEEGDANYLAIASRIGVREVADNHHIPQPNLSRTL